jgi:hypothetical protein
MHYKNENAEEDIWSDQEYVHYHQRFILKLSSILMCRCVELLGTRLLVDHLEIGKQDHSHIIL